MKRRIVLFIAFFLLTLSGAPAALALDASAEEIKIGVLIPLSGYISFFGRQQEASLNIALKEFADLGPVAGFDLKFIVYDTGSTPKDAVLMAQKLINTDKVLSIIGPFLSTVCEQVFPIANRAEVPIITASSTKPGVTKANRPWTFRNIMTMDKMNDPTIRLWTERHGIKSVVILTDIKSKVSEIFGKEVVPNLMKKHGVKIIENIGVVTEDIDVVTQIANLKKTDPDGIVLAGDYHFAADIAREAVKKGFKKPFLGDKSITKDEFIQEGGVDVEGTYAATDFWAGDPSPAVQAFIRKFQKEYGKEMTPHTVAASFYDTLYITRHLIKKTGVSGKPKDFEKDREKIRAGWARLKDFPGLSRTSIDSNGEAWKNYYTLVVQDGKWIRVNE